MSTPAPTPFQNYDTEKLIKYLHGFYHQGGHDEFDLHDSQYRTSLLYLGGAVIFFGGLALIAYFIFLCCRSTFACCRREAGCGPNLSRLLLFILTVCMTIMTLCSYVGYGNFIDGMNGVANDCTKIRDIVLSLDDGADDLADYGDNFDTYASNADCTDNALSSNAAIFKIHAMIYAQVMPAPKYLANFVDIFSKNIPEYVKYLLGFTAGSAAVTSLVTLLGIIGKSSTFLNISSLFSVLLFLLFIVLIGMELTLSVMFADLCYYGPDLALHDLAERTMNDQSIKVVDYYTTCEGTNPLQAQLNKTLTSAIAMNETAYDSLFYNATSSSWETNVCENAAALMNVQSEVRTAMSTIDTMDDAQSCATMNTIYYDLVDSVLCGKTVSGLWELWSVHLAAGALLYICMFFTSHVKQKCKVLVLMDEEGAVKAIPLGPPLAPNTV
jgi:hypothetical protein